MDYIREELKRAVKKLFGVDFEPEVAPAPENVGADYSSNAALKLAKELHRSPMEIAEELVVELNGVEVTRPGFLNFSLTDEYLRGKITELAQDYRGNISQDEYLGKTIICEFSDPNPFKVLHVGHLYTSVVGDAIARLFEYAGAKVVRANFGGDVGLHVAKTIYALLVERSSASTDALFAHRTISTARSATSVSLNSVSANEVSADLSIEDIAKCYVEGTAAYEEDEQARVEITRLNKEIYKINSEKLHDTLVAELYWRGRELSYDYFRGFYDSIGVKFDKYYPESSVAELGLKKVREQLEKGVYEVSDGAVVFDGDKYGLHTRVFINREGVPTYEAKDVGLIFTKWEDYHFDKSVVITGNEQLEYMRVVLKSVEQYASELVERTEHLTHGLVKLPGGVKMSSRKGNFLKAVDVLEMVRGALAEEYGSTDERVVLAATKYAFLRYKMGGDIIFDPGASVKMTGNSGPYLLYACVRAKKILASVVGEAVSESNGLEDVERDLAKKILEYKEVLVEAVREMAPHKVAGYLYELAQEFSRFYEKCPVAGSEREGVRAELVGVYLETMTHGLGILGIEIPEEM